MNIETSPDVISLANSLGYRDGSPVESIREHCLRRIGEIVRGKQVTDMDALEQEVRKKLKLGVYRVHSDEELDRVVQKYVDQGDIVFLTIKQQLSPDAYGVFIKLRKPNEIGEPWVCIIDCRGDKYYRRHWTFWHEVTHCLTAVDEMELPLRRTTIPLESPDEKEPIEVLTDYVAKDLAFYGPIFDPILGTALSGNNGRVSFELVRRVRDEFCPDASLESTLNACVDRCGFPCVIIDAEPGFNKMEKAAREAGDQSIQPSLRVTRKHANRWALGSGLFIPNNYRIPSRSIISYAHRQPEVASLAGLKRVEDLEDWASSRGGTLSSREIYVDARRRGDRVTAIINAAG